MNKNKFFPLIILIFALSVVIYILKNNSHKNENLLASHLLTISDKKAKESFEENNNTRSRKKINRAIASQLFNNQKRTDSSNKQVSKHHEINNDTDEIYTSENENTSTNEIHPNNNAKSVVDRFASPLEEIANNQHEKVSPTRNITSNNLQESNQSFGGKANFITNETDKDKNDEDGFKPNQGGGSASSNSPKMYGIVYPLVPVVVTKNKFSNELLIDSAFASACNAVVSLYEIDSDTKLPALIPIASSALEADGTFNIKIDNKSVLANQPTHYILRVSGCGEEYSRLVTSFYSQQNISLGTSLLAKVLEVQTTNNIFEIKNEDLNFIIDRIGRDSTNYEDVYDEMLLDNLLVDKFKVAFGDDISILTNTKPVVTGESIALIVNEKTNTPFSLQSAHWYSNYNTIQEWYVDDQFQMTGNSFIYSPGANDQGLKKIKIFIGRNDGNGRVNKNISYELREWNLNVIDSVPVSVPIIELNNLNLSPVLSNSFKVNIDTGINLANCESLSFMAITETPFVPALGQFVISCVDQGKQIEDVVLANLSDGAKTLYLWSIDSKGSISPIPSELMYRKDTSLPIGSLDDIVGVINGGRDFTLNFTSFDANELHSLVLEYSKDDGVTYSPIVTLSPGVSSYLWSVPTDTTTEAKVRLIVRDAASKEVSYVTSKFTIDVAVPPAPDYTLETPLITNSNVAQVTINSCTGTTHILLNDGTVPLLNDSGWITCSTALSHYSYNLGSSDGTKTFAIWAKNDVNRISASSVVNVSLDTTLPNAPIITLDESHITNQTQIKLTASQCTDTPYLLFNLGQVPVATDSGWISCTTLASAYSYSILASEGSNSFSVWSKDIAQNISGAATQFNVIYDVTPATHSLNNLNPIVRGNSSVDLIFSSSDLNGIDSNKLEYSINSGSFVLIATSATSPYAWTIPSGNHTNVQLRLTTKDKAGNEVVSTSSMFAIDSIPPSAPAVDLASRYNTNSTLAQITVTNCSDTDGIFINSGTTPNPDDAGWMSCSTIAGNYSYNFPSILGVRSIFVWAKDSVGNISSASVISVNYDTIVPAPPVIVRNSSTISNNNIVTFSATSCSDTPYLLFNNSSKPASNDLGWVVCTTSANHFTYSISTIEAAHGIKVWSKDNAENVSSSSTNFSVIYDVTPPISVIDDLASVIRGGDSILLSFSKSDANGIASSKLEFSQNGSTYVDLVENPTSPYTWNVPSVDSTNSKIRYTVFDNAGNTSNITTSAFNIDIAPPSAPAITLYSPSITSISFLQFSVASCLDTPFIYFSESSVAPARDASEWMSCSNVAGSMGYELIGPISEGLKNIYAYAKDAVGNVSLGTVINVTYDTVFPTIDLTTLLTGTYRGGSDLSLSFSTSDLSGLSLSRLEYTIDGTTYTTIANLLSSDTTYSWTLPVVNTTQAKLRLSAADNSSPTNATFVESGIFSIDSTPPSAPVASLHSNVFTNSRNISLSVVSCTDFAEILVNEGSAPSINDSAWAACTTVPGAIAYTLIDSQGLHNLKVWSKDAVGNVSLSAATVSVNYDSIAPALAFSNLRNLKVDESFTIRFTLTELNVNNTQNFTVSFFDGTATTVTNIASDDGPLNSREYSVNVVAPNVDNTEMEIKVSFTDLAGNSSEIVRKFYSDLHSPSLNFIALNGGASLSQNNNIQVAISASDSVSNITHFCLKYNNQVRPDENASCWVSVSAPSPGITPAKNISFSGYYFQIGFTNDLYHVYAWVKDETGRVSTNAASLGVDYENITYNSGTPPEIKFASATNSDTFKENVESTDLNVPSGSPLYIKWSAEDLEGLDSNPISIKYSTDDITFNELAGGQNLINGQNGSCSIEPGKMTGCVRLISPASTYFKLRIIAKDTIGTMIYANAAPLNEDKLRVIAGNTEHGLDGSARTAVYYMQNSFGNQNYGAKKRIAVSDDGKVFYIDKKRGLLWVDPSNGMLKTFINQTGISSGDGGLVSAATLKSVEAITLDHYNNLLIWDYNKIRKVNLTTMVITHMIGGGATTNPLTTIPESELNLPSLFNSTWGTLIPLPNGDLIFSSTGTLVHYRYRALDQKIERMEMQGTGMFTLDSHPWSAVGQRDLGVIYDPTTSQINFMIQQHYISYPSDSYSIASLVNATSGSENNPYLGNGPHSDLWTQRNLHDGLNGKLYLTIRFRSSLEYYDSISKTLITVLGTGSEASIPCPDGTIATSCAVGLDSFFVSKSGRIYFVDNGIIRTIDDNNRVITLFGQYSSYGDNVSGTVARFGSVQDIALGKNSDTIVIEDISSNTFRELKIDGNIQTLTSACYSWSGPISFEVDRRNGDIISTCGNLRRFDRNNLTWSNVVGGGSTGFHLPEANGLTGDQISVVSGYNSSTVGIVGTKVFWMKYFWDGWSNRGCAIKSYDMDDSYRQGHVAGKANYDCGTTTPAIGTDLTTQYVGIGDYSKFRYFVDPSDSISKYFYAKVQNNKIYKTDNFGAVQEFVTLNKTINSFTYAMKADGLNLYYCSVDGSLYKYIYNTSTVVQLTWKSTTTKCVASRNIIYNQERNSLIFPIEQNLLFGIAEYSLD